MGNLPGKSEVDVPLSYADYYYLEGLMRLGRSSAIRGLPDGRAGGNGWARSSVNAVIFRQHGLLTHDGTQFAAYYDPEGAVVLARRPPGADEWEMRRTRYRGNVRDAHDAISLGVDGAGCCTSAGASTGTRSTTRGTSPGSLELTDPLSMTGEDEAEVTYPQFYELAGGDLLFVYRDGGSGDGDVDARPMGRVRREVDARSRIR